MKLERILDRISPEPMSGCWLWVGNMNVYSYGTISYRHAPQQMAHRVVYELYKKPIPEGCHLDHKCRIRICVNPDHTEPVTPGENTRRALPYRKPRAPKTHCPHGHLMTGDNLYMSGGKRYCIACNRRHQRRRAA